MPLIDKLHVYRISNLSKPPIRYSPLLFLLIAALPFAGNSPARAQRYLATLGTVTEVPTGAGAHAIMTGDFNGDGLTDIATMGKLEVYLSYQQAGSAGWNSGKLYAGKPILAGAAGRCNRDHLADIVLLTDEPPEARVYRSKPSGGFVLAWKCEVSSQFGNVLLADADNDRKTDIILFGKRHLGITVMRGRGNGSFLLGATLFPEYSFGALSVEDLNGDGINDIVGANWVSNELMLFTGFGTLHFSEPAVVAFSSEPRFFSTGRLDSDPNKDLVVCLPEEGRCRLLLGDGLGSFHSCQDVALNGVPSGLGVADVNGDGKEDIGLLSADEGSLTLGLNNGERLEDFVVFRGGGFPTDFSFVKHGRTSLVDAIVLDSAASRLRILQNAMIDKSGDQQETYALGLHPEGVLAADLNHDGWNDIVVTDSRSRSLSLFLNGGKDGFEGQISFRTPTGLSFLRYVPKNDSIALFLGTGADTATTTIVEINMRSYSHGAVNLPTQEEQSILSARVDSSTQELHVLALERETPRGGGECIEYEQIGPARFIERSVALDLTEPIIAATVCDVTHDGIPDLLSLVYEEREKRKSIYLSPRDSGETFGRPRLVLTMDSTRPARALLWTADLNGDGFPDMIADFPAPENLLEVSLGRNDTTFSSACFKLNSPISVSSNGDLEILDMNGDGIMDLVVLNEVDRSIEVYTGLGEGTFMPGFHLISTKGLGGFTLGDVNRDGTPELIITDSESGVLKILSPGKER